MASRARRRQRVAARKPQVALAPKSPRAEVVMPSGVQPSYQPPALVQTYGEPTAEKVLTSFDQYVDLAYGGNAVVFGLLNVQMRLFSEARLCWRDLDDLSLTYDPGDQLEKLRRPWPNGFTGDMLARMRQDAAIAGNAYVRDCGDRLERLRPDWVTIVSWVTEDASGRQVREVLGFMYDPTGDAERAPDWYPVDEVAHWAPIPDPKANFRGMSWLTPALREINADRAMTEHREKFFRSAATPNIIIKYSGKVSPTQKVGLAESIAAKHGGPDKAGGTLVLDEGADLEVVGSKFSDAQFQEVLAATENRMAVAAGVPALLAGLKEGLDAAAWSMYRQAMRAFADLFVRPDWRSAVASLSVLVDVPDGKELWYDTRDIAALQEGEAEQASRVQVEASTLSSLITAGYTPESAVKFVSSGDVTQLEHSGLVSVQLLPPGPQEQPTEDDGGTSADPDAPDDDTGGPSEPPVEQEDEEDEMDRALAALITEEMARSRAVTERVLDWAMGMADIQRGWTKDTFEEARVNRDAKGRFGKGLGAVAAALMSKEPDALDGFNREQLRREARKRGIALPRGASTDAIRDALWDNEDTDSPPDAPDVPQTVDSSSSHPELLAELTAARADDAPRIRELLETLSKAQLFDLARDLATVRRPQKSTSRDRLIQEIYAGTAGLFAKQREVAGGVDNVWGWQDREQSDVDFRVPAKPAAPAKPKTPRTQSGSPKTPAAPVELPDGIVDRLQNAGDDDGPMVREMLDDLSKPQLVALAKQLGPIVAGGSGKTREQLVHNIFDGTVGFRGRQRAVAGSNYRDTSTAETFATAEMPSRIADAYQRLRRDDNPWVSLAALREQLGGTREEQDAALISLARERRIRLIPEENQKTITSAVRDAAITLTGEDKHLIGFQ